LLRKKQLLLIFHRFFKQVAVGDDRTKQTFLFPAMASPMIGDDRGQSATYKFLMRSHKSQAVADVAKLPSPTVCNE
jgi:hypothetical protein